MFHSSHIANLQYVDSVRFGNLTAFLQLESATKGWWFPTLDRGAGALLHFAVDHGRLNMVKYFVEQRRVPINQRDRVKGWTPLHRCAYIAHYHHAPFFEIFEYLLSVGADPSLRAYSQEQGTSSLGTMALDLVVKKGAGWEEGQVRAWLQKLVDKYNKTPKMPEYVYDGPPMGKNQGTVTCCWFVRHLSYLPSISALQRNDRCLFLQAQKPFAFYARGSRCPSFIRLPVGGRHLPQGMSVR